MHLIEAGLTVAAVLLLITAGWFLFAYCSPYRKCRWCEAFASVGMRCRRCKGAKLTRRLGSRTAHRTALALRQAWEER